MKIPMKHAIDAGVWLQCETQAYNFRIKVNSFERVKLSEIDKTEEIDTRYDLKQGDFWVLKFEVISLTKQTIIAWQVRDCILVIDLDNFEYTHAQDHHLEIFSNYAKHSGLNDFISINLYPKIKYKGTELFFLPKEDNAEYFISVESGNIKEM